MGLFDGYEADYFGNARLVILRALADEDDGRLNDTLLMSVLKAFSFNKDRSFLLTQLDWLEKQAGAVVVRKIGTAVVAEITEVGENHVNRTAFIAGVQKPSRRRV